VHFYIITQEQIAIYDKIA